MSTLVPPTIIVAPGAALGPQQAPLLLSLTQASDTVVANAIRDVGLGTTPVAATRLYRSGDINGPFTAVGDEPISRFALRNVAFDRAPLFGAQTFYRVTAIDEAGGESDPSNILGFVPFSNVAPITPVGALTAAALGPYPWLGSDVFLDPLTGEGLVGPNGDLLTVNGLECLAQDLRIKLLTRPGELRLDPTIGFQVVIGGTQAAPALTAQILIADVKTFLRAEQRVAKILSIQVAQSSSDAFGWVLGYEIVARGVADAKLSDVFPYVTA